ncbi:MAG: RHS repeat-associated core domain-containing protein [Lysobacterales bacterium]
MQTHRKGLSTAALVIRGDGVRYDGFGRRVKEVKANGSQDIGVYSQSGQRLYSKRGAESTRHIYLGNTLLAQTKTVGGIPQPDTYLHTDALGSVIAESTASGSIAKRNDYAPWGEPISGPLDGLGYTGHEMDPDTGLVYAQQRYYDPIVGRFLSIDPVAADANTGGNFNRYWYANNNPYRFTDPDGRFGIDELIRNSSRSMDSERNCQATPSCRFRLDESEGGSKTKLKQVSNVTNGAGGVAEIASGVALCSTGAACVVGIPVIVFGASNIGEAATGLNSVDGKGFNLVNASIETGLKSLDDPDAERNAVGLGSALNLLADLASLRAPMVAVNFLGNAQFKLFRRLPDDFVRAVDVTSQTAILLQAATTMNTTATVLEVEQ